MKHFVLGAALAAMTTSAAAAAPTPPPAHAHPHAPTVAPADEYFGRLKLSILGIRNTIKDDGLKIDADPSTSTGVVAAVVYTEDALHDWETKYPKDSWLPRMLFTLERLYAKIDSDAARAKAKATMMWLVHDFPSSPQAKIGRDELAANKVGVKPVIVEASDATGPVPIAPAVPGTQP